MSVTFNLKKWKQKKLKALNSFTLTSFEEPYENKVEMIRTLILEFTQGYVEVMTPCF